MTSDPGDKGMKKLVVIFAVLALSSFSLAGNPPNDAAKARTAANALSHQQKRETLTSRSLITPNGVTDCSFTFTSGVNNNTLEFCVTDHGNIAELQTPIGHPLVSVEDRSEGYAICDVSGPSRVAYSDFGFFVETGNWNNPVVLSQTTTSVKIARTTSDGIWTLTQTISQVASNASVKIVMALKNNTAVPREAFLVRYADVDVDDFLDNNFDGTTSSAFAWNPISSDSAAPVGLLLQNIGTLRGIGTEGFGQNTFEPPDPCNPGATFPPSTLLSTDGSLVLLYDMHVPKQGSQSVMMNYKGL
jgi:hypothetical protein